MRFQVPQFIEVEDKLFGPLTFKQFIYLAGGGGAVVVLFFYLPNFLAFIFSIPIVALSLALSFYKINNRPFIGVVESFFKYLVGSKLYTWKKEAGKITPNSKEGANTELFVPKLSQSKLKDMAWTLDVRKETEPVDKGV